MPSIGRAGMDIAGGIVINGANSVIINDCPAVRQGSRIKDHGLNKHDNAKMLQGFRGVIVEDLPVCTDGMPASCGNPLMSSSNVEAG